MASLLGVHRLWPWLWCRLCCILSSLLGTQWPHRKLRSLEKKIASLRAEQRYTTDGQGNLDDEIRKLEIQREMLVTGNDDGGDLGEGLSPDGDEDETEIPAVRPLSSRRLADCLHRWEPDAGLLAGFFFSRAFSGYLACDADSLPLFVCRPSLRRRSRAGESSRRAAAPRTWSGVGGGLVLHRRTSLRGLRR